MIVIVGAGLAGLSAAHRLIQGAKVDAKQILILEANNRIGGRIQSLSFQDGSRIDLGAQWLHGEKNNPIYKWLDSLGLIQGLEQEEIEFEGLFRSPLSKLKDKSSSSRGVIAKVLDLLLEAKSFLYKTSQTIDSHAKPIDIFRSHIETQKNLCNSLKGADKNLIEAVEKWFELYEIIDNSCEDMSMLSIRAYSDWTDFDEGKMVLLNGGWQSLVNKLADSIGQNRIRLLHRVKQVHYHKLGASVIVINNLDSVIELKCDHVIMTCSLGVLKSFGANLFKPPLSQSRLSCIEKCGFGVVNKIFLCFNEPFLQQERGLNLLWPAGEENAKCKDLPEWVKYITGFDIVSGAPKLLLGWIGGRGAEMIEQVQDDKVGQVCLQIFELFLTDKSVPKLAWAKRSAWQSDHYIRGSYSYPSVKSIDEDMSHLWDPLCLPLDDEASGKTKYIPRVLFAGEATAKNMYATAHGAIISGWREADRLARI